MRTRVILILLAGLVLSTRARADAVIFMPAAEPREQAFTVLVPDGWRTEGGIFRVDPNAAGGALQSIAAKCDFTVKNDDAGTVMLRWLPDMLYFDPRGTPLGQTGLFPPGSNYNGATVMPLIPPAQFLAGVAFPYAHPRAEDVQIVEQKSLPDLAGKYRQWASVAMAGMTFGYEAAMTTVTYTEGGTAYKERMLCVIENWGQMGAGLWGNKETLFFRAPAAEFERWVPYLHVIQNSVRISPEWMAGEIRGQIQRGEIARQTQQEIARIDREIVEHRRNTNAEINNDMFLTLTGQEDFVNPFTNEVERDTSEWKYRWTDANGARVFSNEERYDPNHDLELNKTGFKRTPVRER